MCALFITENGSAAKGALGYAVPNGAWAGHPLCSSAGYKRHGVWAPVCGESRFFIPHTSASFCILLPRSSAARKNCNCHHHAKQKSCLLLLPSALSRPIPLRLPPSRQSLVRITPPSPLPIVQLLPALPCPALHPASYSPYQHHIYAHGWRVDTFLVLCRLIVAQIYAGAGVSLLLRLPDL
ncbi:hypothetical protein GQ54DRAFT_90061 [Martensiomyces pterosporus]|nr:hypothetical protein GQ54DRAFT_90061 [Martensiomyces pterosporus]